MKVDMLLSDGRTRYRSSVKACMVGYGMQQVVMLMPTGERISEPTPQEIHIIAEPGDGQVIEGSLVKVEGE